ncbi:MAG: SRPBCC family protein [Candidatus Limnocylindria bacterium]
MGRVEMATPIRATPEQIFEFVSDVHRYPEWDAFADEILAASDSALRKGSTYRERSGRDESDWKVTEFDPPRRQKHVGDVPFLGEVTVEMDLVPRGDVTEFRHAVGYHVMPGFLRPVGWLIERVYVNRYARSRMRQTHAAAKRIIE